MWRFLSRAYGELDGFSDGGLAEFKGNPLASLAREICQNSLDARDDSGEPVIVEFERIFMPTYDFPGMKELRDVIEACDSFWKGKADKNTEIFLASAKKELNKEKFFVLRVSDYNTKGVTGAFSTEDITPWGSLVKGNSFSVKKDTKNAAGSYGLGKAAPFVNSRFQTVFYRTLDEEGVKAAMGVARLMAHKSINSVPPSEDPIRRAVGYYSENNNGSPMKSIPELDKINTRTLQGTDLFIPGFAFGTADDAWINEILKVIIENFLVSIFNGKLEIKIEEKRLNRSTLSAMINKVDAKDARVFYEVIRKNNPDVVETERDFHKLGSLKLRLLFQNDMNKQVLVVRNSGMKVAKIPSLPRQISYTGFLELIGDDLNAFFREMENPRHDKWEYNRHSDPKKAKLFLRELENWVVDTISEKLVELSGDEADIELGDCFIGGDVEETGTDQEKKETLTDETQKIESEIYIPKTHTPSGTMIPDEGENGQNRKTRGTADPAGDRWGHRTPTGGSRRGKPTGRTVRPDPSGRDTMNDGTDGKPREVFVMARIISQGNGEYQLVITPEEDISKGKIVIVTKGENGKSLNLSVRSASGRCARAENGYILIENMKANQKEIISLKLVGNHNFAMGVKAYED